MFQIIIPVVNIDLFNILFNNILENTILPTKIIIINNSSDSLAVPSRGEVEFRIITPPTPLPVNTSWNLGISHLSKCDFVSILNDDIEIPRTFFERIANGFKKISKAGVICPCTVTDKRQINNFLLVDVYDKMKKKEGWAFTIRKEILDTIPPIHSELKMFFGDDWFWWHVFRGGSGCIWYKDHGTIIYHAVGTALRKLDYRERNLQKKRERTIWYALKTEYVKSGVCKL